MRLLCVVLQEEGEGAKVVKGHGKVLFKDVNLGIDLETRIGRDNGSPKINSCLPHTPHTPPHQDAVDACCCCVSDADVCVCGGAGIVGPNGAGKSTLLNLMLDKLRPLDGNVFR